MTPIAVLSVNVPLDPFLCPDIRASAAGSCTTISTTRPTRCPHLCGGRQDSGPRSAFDAWIEAFREVGQRDVDQIVTDVLREIAALQGCSTK